MAAIIVEGLRKDYGPVRAVDDLTFSVAEGEIFALLGPNGAGKTTSLEILEGVPRADGGHSTSARCGSRQGWSRVPRAHRRGAAERGL